MIEEYDNVFNDEERKELIKKIDNSSWKFGHSATPEAYRRFWFINLKDDKFYTNQLFERIQFLIKAQCKLHRVFANGQTYGLDGDWHQDSIEKNEYTFVYYVNEEWKSNWGGETLFSIDNKIISVMPKHNKGILFPSNVSHYGKAPARDCYKLRVTIAFFFTIQNWLK